MVYGIIEEKGEKFYTHMKKVFDSIGNIQENYNWLITDCECYPSNPQVAKLLEQDYCWLSGEELTSIVSEQDFQWIWAVLAGFDKNIPLEEVLNNELPTVNYEGFWENPLTMQHPLSTIEIVPFDSSFTLFFSRDKEIADNFMAGFPLSEDLAFQNEK